MPANLIDAMQAAGPAPRVYDPDMAPVMNLIRQLAGRRDIARIAVDKPGFKLEMRGRPALAEA